MSIPIFFPVFQSCANSEPLSVVILRNTLSKCGISFCNLFKQLPTALTVFPEIRLIISFRVLRSVNVSNTRSFDCFPITRSISQCPNCSLLDIISGRCSMLIPFRRLCFLSFFVFLFTRRPAFSGRSIFLIFSRHLFV